MKQILLAASLSLYIAPVFACQVTQISESACTPATSSTWDQTQKKQRTLSHKEVTLKDSCTGHSWTEKRICNEQFSTDTTAPACTTKFSEVDTNGNTYWVNHPIVASLEACTDSVSGCNNASALEQLVQDHNQTGSVTIQDYAGNRQTCQPTTASSQIDKVAPRITSLHITSTQTSTKNPLILWESGESKEVSLVAADKYHLQIIANDPDATAQSGQSGINWNQTEIIITDAQEKVKVHDVLANLTGVDLSTTDIAGGKEITFDTQISGSNYTFLTESGFYRFAIIIKDQAKNRSISLGHYLQIVPGNPDSYDITSVAKTSNGTSYQNGICDNLVADAVGGCRFIISVKDSFGNILGNTGTLRSDAGVIPSCTANYVKKSTSPPSVQNVSTWEHTPYGYDETEALFLKWDCTASSATIPVAGAEIQCNNYPTLPSIVDESGEYPLFWSNISSDEILTCQVAPFTDEKIFSNYKTIKQLNLPKSCRYNFFNGYLCLDAWLPF